MFEAGNFKTQKPDSGQAGLYQEASVNGCQEPLFSGFESAVLILRCSGLR